MAEIEVLHLEDNRADSDLVEHLLVDDGVPAALLRVQTRQAFTDALADRNWDVILADYALPSFDGYAALKIAQQLAPDVPFIFVTGRLGEEVVVETLKRGATDYVLKQKMERLAPAVRRALRDSAEKRLLRETEDRLRDSEQRYRLLIDGIHDYAICLIRPDGNVASWNAGAERIFGYSDAEAAGRPIASLFLKEDQREQRWERLVRRTEQAGRVEEELWLVRKGGTPFWANLILAPLRSAQTLNGFAALVQDVSQRQRAKAQEEHNREERALQQERFLSHVSHELRTPLATVVDFTSIVAEGIAGPINEQQREHLGVVLQAATRLATMVNSLLDLTRSDWRRLPVQPDCILLQEVVCSACDSLTPAAAEKNISLLRSCAPDLPLVYADASRITEVLCNLLDNAIKYSPAGSNIEVKVEVYSAEPDFVAVSVSDNGPGIPAEQAGRIFERFYRVTEASGEHPGGLGLGLYISREIVRTHGGDMTLRSVPGQGSTFQFTLPRFSLQRILLPAVSRKNLGKGTVALITVKLPEVPNCPTGDFDRYLASIRQILQRLVYTEDDVVLPHIALPGLADRLYVVAFTREAGLPIILERIRERLNGCLEIQPLRGQFDVSAHSVDISSWRIEEVGIAAEKIAEALAASIGLSSAGGGEDHVRRKAESAGSGR